MHHILLVEDDPEVVRLIELHFDRANFDCTSVSDAHAALSAIRGGSFDLLILDICLPDGNGMELCKKVRATDTETPIIMLTGNATEADTILALELGADDYITKPFSMLELKARIKAVLRRSRKLTEPIVKGDLRFGDLFIEGEKRKVSLSGFRVDLTVREFEILWMLAANPGKTFTRKEILQEIWGVGFEGYEHTITSHINRLRLKLEKDINHPSYILTAWGSGYRFAE